TRRSSDLYAIHHSGSRVIGAARSAGSGTQCIISNRLRGMRLDARTELESIRQSHVGKQIEFVPFVAIGERVVFAEIEAVEVAEGEWITFIGVIIQVFREYIVELQLIILAEALLGSHSEAPIERMRGALRIGNCAEIGERRGSVADRIDIVSWLDREGGAGVRVYEAGEDHALRICQVYDNGIV